MREPYCEKVKQPPEVFYEKKVMLKISQNPQESKNLIFKKFADLRPDGTFSTYKEIIVLLKRTDVFLFSET